MSLQRPHQDRPLAPFASYQGAIDTSLITPDTHETMVVTNHITLQPKMNRVSVYTMVMDDLPSDPSARTCPSASIPQQPERKRVFEALCKLQPLQGRDDFTTDYETLWIESALPPPLTFHNVTYHNEIGQPVVVPRVVFKLIHHVNLSRGSPEFAGADTKYYNPVGLTRAVNNLIIHSITSQAPDTLFPSGSNQFFIESKGPLSDSVENDETLPEALQVQRGYYTSIRPGTHNILLNIDIIHGTFLKPMVVSHFLDDMDEYFQHYGDASDLLVGRAVRIMYERPTLEDGIDRNAEANRIKIVLETGEVPQIQQFESGGKMWTVKEWFESQGIVINELHHVCLNVGSTSNSLWLPAELVELMPNQIFDRPLGVDHMKAMSKIADQHPAMNQAAIQEEGLALLEHGSLNNDLSRKLFSGSGKALLQIPATILAAPTIQYRNGIQKPTENNASWDIGGEPFVNFTSPAVKINSKLCVLDFRLADSKPSPGNFAQLWMECCESHGLFAPGWKISPDEAENVMSTHATLPETLDKAEYFREMQQIMETVQEKMKQIVETLQEKQQIMETVKEKQQILETAQETSSATFLVVLLPDVDAAAYAAIKRIGDTKLGMHTICCEAPTICCEELESEGFKFHPYDKMVLRQNLKAPKSQNHTVMDSDVSAFAALASNTLVIGVDVVHPGNDTPSIVAMVGSTDADFATFTGQVRLQRAEQRVLDREVARELVGKSIVNWSTAHPKDKLQRIIYYRDGVEEDEYHLVKENEITAIQEAIIAETKGFDEVSITAIMVSTQHHTSFFAPNDSTTFEDFTGHDSQPPGDQNLNGPVQPGLLVDSIITQPSISNLQDFFLQSHVAPMAGGTARPTHYMILQNDPESSKFTLKQLELLTHAFCYNYAAATEAVPYCTPAYYADQLCDRVHQYLKSYLGVERPCLEPYVGESLDDFRERIRDYIVDDTNWIAEGRDNPWHSDMDDVMFWL
ncbi:uncharacterized protein RCC_02755 [Ramularia collo-cygni]|uniref:Piwi domain-containing protein n=1 Tax=Ramularia collo-cygni TaxID=112498 RepID=A0A2D3UP20_9PEZI|nr:uncharacterized protein RCC_02755 [Ramularia collo-cygni]CZT16921.1 uncharacterized protein RCC_02755 [Ramularia collo-cygni]